MDIGLFNTGIQPSSFQNNKKNFSFFFSEIEETFSNTDKQLFSTIICKIIFYCFKSKGYYRLFLYLVVKLIMLYYFKLLLIDYLIKKYCTYLFKYCNCLINGWSLPLNNLVYFGVYNKSLKYIGYKFQSWRHEWYVPFFLSILF